MFILDFLINDPLYNLLNLFYDLLNHDIGFTILTVAALLNLALFPLFRDSYITGQKMKVLSPELKKIQKANKDNPQAMLAASREFNKKHGIKNGATFLALILQITFFTGLYFMIRHVSDGDTLSGMYESWFGYTERLFSTNTLIANLNIGDRTSSHMWMIFLVTFLTFFQGYYTFRLAPKPNLPIPKAEPVKEGQFDAAKLQKTMETFSIYILPALFFLINMTLTVGVTLYFLASSTIAIFRQFVLSTFYTKHIEELFKDIEVSDPASVKKSNKVNQTYSQEEPTAGKVVTVKAKSKKKKASKKKGTTGSKKK